MNRQNELKMGAEQKRWQASEKYEKNKAKMAETKVQEKEMVDEYNNRKTKEREE